MKFLELRFDFLEEVIFKNFIKFKLIVNGVKRDQVCCFLYEPSSSLPQSFTRQATQYLIVPLGCPQQGIVKSDRLESSRQIAQDIISGSEMKLWVGTDRMKFTATNS